ncbi:DUF1015 domain-containing protein [Vibrio sp. S4M6]|uniref:DUF1015 family protein n=1 Tax=Vibrio sinus TaxID=2946865 RepID=UPI00202A2200|nr:DUF1015 family protein [Vibrio sinus]MCL9781626.1 DUF1015 domain-containing protein [Vibrio sinus]
MAHLDAYYIYRIEGNWNNIPHQVTGLLYNYHCDSFFEKPIIPHENTNPNRVESLEKLSPNLYPPSFWITDSNNFPLGLINQWFDESENKISIPSSDGMSHTISRLEGRFQNQLITKALSTVPNFLIADGHHRYEAIKQKRYTTALPVFVISSSQAAFQFNELCFKLKENTNIDCLLSRISENWLTQCRIDEADIKINFANNTWGLRLKENDRKNANIFILVYEKLKQINEITSIKTSPECSRFDKECVSVKVVHSNVSHVIQEGVSGRRMPIKSTCFGHKPNENILQHIAKAYSNDSMLEGALS